MRKVIIVGSSRNDGNTQYLVESIKNISDYDSIDLNDYAISYYDYEHENENDDYLNLMNDIVNKYDVLIFATPVYWYSMSGIMKVFFDRITDLLTIKKDIGRKLKGKKMVVITTSNGNNLGDKFWLPFQETANYLGMDYLCNLHTMHNEKSDDLVKRFVDEINSYSLEPEFRPKFKSKKSYKES